MSKTLLDIYSTHKENINSFKECVPFDCWRGFTTHHADFLHLTETGFAMSSDTDHLTISEWRTCLAWWVNQLGGEVKWK